MCRKMPMVSSGFEDTFLFCSGFPSQYYSVVNTGVRSLNLRVNAFSVLTSTPRDRVTLSGQFLVFLRTVSSSDSRVNSRGRDPSDLRKNAGERRKT